MPLQLVPEPPVLEHYEAWKQREIARLSKLARLKVVETVQISPPQLNKRRLRSCDDWDGWYEIWNLNVIAETGDVICIKGVDPEVISRRDVNLCNSYRFSTGWCHGYQLKAIRPRRLYEVITTRSRAPKKGYIWRRIGGYRSTRFKMNPIFSKPHPFFSRDAQERAG